MEMAVKVGYTFEYYIWMYPLTASSFKITYKNQAFSNLRSIKALLIDLKIASKNTI